MTQRTLLVTGASSGIGHAAAFAMLRRGWHVIATARKPADIERLERENALDVVPLELADPASIAACAARVAQLAGGAPDALFNNAAFGLPGAVEDLTAEALRHQIEVNVIGTHDLTRRLLPGMLARGSGRIVQCSSVLGFMAAPFRGAYCASKFALEGLTDSLRLELAGTGVRVAIIEPGPIRSRFIDNAVAASRRWIDIEGSRHSQRYAAMLAALEAGGRQTFKLEPEAVVAKLIHALESPRPAVRYRVTTPTHAAAMLKRLLPDRALDWIAARN